jgi:threonine dehydrogenase-like Zn-dependent dehydrogenase
MLDKRGLPSRADVEAFLTAGFEERDILQEVLAIAVESTEPEGTLHSVGYHGDPMTPLPLFKLYTRGIRFLTGRAHSAALLPEVLALIGEGRLDPGAVPRTLISWNDAPAHYLDDAIKLIVAR